ncbi:DUF6063 family protein [Clostridium sp.]
MNNTTKIALTIFKKSLENERINSTNNEELYESYKYDTNVSNEVEEMLEIFNMDIYDNSNDGLLITTGVNNSVFGYSNEEFRKALSIKNNTELSICFFLMYCILTRFYKESSLIPTAELITQKQLLEDADNKVLIIKTMLEQREKEDVSRNRDEEDTSFAKLVKFWTDMSHNNIVSKAKDTSKDEKSSVKVSYANKTLKFFCANNLLTYNEIQNIYMVRPKLSTLVGYYYDEHKNRNEIVEYLESLKCEDITENSELFLAEN